MAKIYKFKQKKKRHPIEEFQYATHTELCPKCGSKLKTIHECCKCGTIELLCSSCNWGMRREL